MNTQHLRGAIAAACMMGAAFCAPVASANTVVEFNTTLGSFDVSLDDAVAPSTVANFLNYVQAGSYTDTVVHRSVPGFVIQGGGFHTDFTTVATSAPIAYEQGLSNVRGTIALARTSDLNSATSQWFINTADNLSLDTGKYAAFGTVIGDGMKVVDAIAALGIYNLSNFAGGAFGEVPLHDVGNATSFSPSFFVTTSIKVVPEPQTWMLMGLGLTALAFSVRRARPS
jgi:peptidyl-prolyl cis-trans isomerase A (cyclophilin A)